MHRDLLALTVDKVYSKLSFYRSSSRPRGEKWVVRGCTEMQRHTQHLHPGPLGFSWFYVPMFVLYGS